MLTAVIFINENVIDTVCMWNQNIENKKGQHQYKCWLKGNEKRAVIVWHKREDGWEVLLTKALKSIKSNILPW
jgi:hypothetical protein